MAWLGLAAGPANGASRAKSGRAQFATMAEVLKALGKPDSIANVRLDRLGGYDYLNIIALVYAKPRKQEFFISRTGKVVQEKSSLLYPVRTSGSPRSAVGQRKTVADLCNRFGNPDAVWGAPRDWWGRTPLAVQLTFDAAKKRYQIGGDGYVLATIELSDDVEAWRGRNVADAFRDFGKPDALMHPDNFSAKGEKGTPEPTLVMMYRRFRSRRWFVAADGRVIAIIPNKFESMGRPEWYAESPEREHGESIADRVNRQGKPDRIEAVALPKGDGFAIRSVFVLTYRRLNQRICFSEEGYLLDDQTACPARPGAAP